MIRMDSGARRGVALVGVLLLHAALVFVVALALRTHGGTPQTPDPVTTLILMPLPLPAVEPVPGRVDPSRRSFSAPRSTAITVPPLPAQPHAAPVDWDQAARHAAAAATAAAQTRALDHNPASDAPASAASPAIAVHRAGEQYRDPADGTSIVYISDHCYIASSPPPLGTPDVITRAAASRTVCKGDPGWSRPDLFKDLPAYEKYHPKDPARP